MNTRFGPREAVELPATDKFPGVPGQAPQDLQRLFTSVNAAFKSATGGGADHRIGEGLSGTLCPTSTAFVLGIMVEEFDKFDRLGPLPCLFDAGLGSGTFMLDAALSGLFSYVSGIELSNNRQNVTCIFRAVLGRMLNHPYSPMEMAWGNAAHDPFRHFDVDSTDGVAYTFCKGFDLFDKDQMLQNIGENGRIRVVVVADIGRSSVEGMLDALNADVNLPPFRHVRTDSVIMQSREGFTAFTFSRFDPLPVSLVGLVGLVVPSIGPSIAPSIGPLPSDFSPLGSGNPDFSPFGSVGSDRTRVLSPAGSDIALDFSPFGSNGSNSREGMPTMESLEEIDDSNEVIDLSESFSLMAMPSVFDGVKKDYEVIDASHRHFDEGLTRCVGGMDLEGVIVTLTSTKIKLFTLKKGDIIVKLNVEHDTVSLGRSNLRVSLKAVPPTSLKSLVSSGDYQAVFSPPPDSIGRTPPTRMLNCNSLGIPDIPVSIESNYLVDGGISLCIVIILPVSAIADLPKLLAYVFE